MRIFNNLPKLSSEDTANSVVTYDSMDSADANSWTDVDIITSGEKHHSLFKKISTMFKNIRYIFKKLGTTDISAIGDGTVTGGLSKINNDLGKALSIGHTVALFHYYTDSTIIEANEEIFDLTDAWNNYRFLYIKTGNGDGILNSCNIPTNSLYAGNIIDLAYQQGTEYKHTKVTLLEDYTKIKLTLGTWSNVTIYGVM